MNKLDKTFVNILWTGGYDSTYRMVQLSKHEITIQPYYLCDNNRRSRQKELEAIAVITKDIERHDETRCMILPHIRLQVEDIKPDKEITDAYCRLNETTKIGPQYDWLARFAKTISGLELCVEKAKSNKARDCIFQYGDMKMIKDNELSYCIIDEEKSSEDLIKVFGAFHFPLPLFELTKLEMKGEFIKLGFENTMTKTWFCHSPINKGGEERPCGICNPCKSVIEEGMGFRLTEEALRRYNIEKKLEKFRIYRYIKVIRKKFISY